MRHTILKISSLDVLELIANGKTYKEIAAEHCVNQTTIRKRTIRFIQSIGATNKTHAVAILVKKGRITIR